MAHIGSRSLINEEVRLSYRTIPRSARPAAIPTVVVTGVAWLFSFILIAMGLTALFTASMPVGSSVTLAAVGAAVAIYMVAFTGKFLTDFGKRYIFELTDSEARLKIKDESADDWFIVRMPFSEVAFVEHFTPRDQVSLVFHSKTDRILEVPIWTMTNDVKPITEFLASRGLNFIRI